MAYLLVIIEFEQILSFDVVVSPHDVPLLRLFGSLSNPAELLDHKLNDVVVGF